MKIRKLRPSDIKAASSIVSKNYSKTYGKRSVKELEAMFKNWAFNPTYFIAEENKKITGFGGYNQSSMDYHIYEIFWINVSAINQRSGIGTKLVEHIINEIKKKKGNDKASLILLTTTKPNFYFKFGFKTVSNRSKNYGLMSLRLSK